MTKKSIEDEWAELGFDVSKLPSAVSSVEMFSSKNAAKKDEEFESMDVDQVTASTTSSLPTSFSQAAAAATTSASTSSSSTFSSQVGSPPTSSGPRGFVPQAIRSGSVDELSASERVNRLSTIRSAPSASSSQRSFSGSSSTARVNQLAGIKSGGGGSGRNPNPLPSSFSEKSNFRFGQTLSSKDRINQLAGISGTTRPSSSSSRNPYSGGGSGGGGNSSKDRINQLAANLLKGKAGGSSSSLPPSSASRAPKSSGASNSSSRDRINQLAASLRAAKDSTPSTADSFASYHGAHFEGDDLEPGQVKEYTSSSNYESAYYPSSGNFHPTGTKYTKVNEGKNERQPFQRAPPREDPASRDYARADAPLPSSVSSIPWGDTHHSDCDDFDDDIGVPVNQTSSFDNATQSLKAMNVQNNPPPPSASKSSEPTPSGRAVCCPACQHKFTI